VKVRRAEDRDAQDLFGLLALCFADFPGCYVDPHDDLKDLRAPGASFTGEGEAFLVVEDEAGRVCACAALDRPAPGTAELHRLYVRPDQRRAGLAAALVERLEALARSGGATRMAFWSDTRFSGAHRFYERLGYRRTGAARDLGDISRSTEHQFARDLG
jgi:putative acetyltransferase